ncbi:hypothetical protein BB560_006184, partial [Smittium megazygosporum]
KELLVKESTFSARIYDSCLQNARDLLGYRISFSALDLCNKFNSLPTSLASAVDRILSEFLVLQKSHLCKYPDPSDPQYLVYLATVFFLLSNIYKRGSVTTDAFQAHTMISSSQLNSAKKEILLLCEPTLNEFSTWCKQSGTSKKSNSSSNSKLSASNSKINQSTNSATRIGADSSYQVPVTIYTMANYSYYPNYKQSPQFLAFQNWKSKILNTN